MLRYKYACLYLIFLIAFLGIKTADGQAHDNYISGPTQTGAKGSAMADAYVSNPSDVGSSLKNPASLSFLRSYSILLNTAYNPNPSTLNGNILLPLRIDNIQTIAIGGYSSYWRNFWYRSLDLGYSGKLTSTFSAGILFDVGYSRSESRNYWGATCALGLLYAPSSGVNYAIAYKGIGRSIHIYFNGHDQYFEIVNAQRSIQVGTSFWFPSENRPPYLNLSLEIEQEIGMDNFISKAGVEIRPLQLIAVRFGIYSRPSLTTGRLGLGILVYRYGLDYSIVPSRTEERIQQLSVSIPF
jgi:hypothetical protein